MRHAATQDLLTRQDCLVVASVSCIYNIGSPTVYQEIALDIKPGQKIQRKEFLARLTNLQYQRSDIDFKPGVFRVRGEIVEIYLITGKEILRIEFLAGRIKKVLVLPATLTSRKQASYGTAKLLTNTFKLYPAHFWVAPQEKLSIAIENIKLELQERLKILRKEGKLIETQRLEQRVNYDLEMLKESGYCHGIENYSRHLEFRKTGEPPYTLIDYFLYPHTKRGQGAKIDEVSPHHGVGARDFLIFIDESHLTISQLKAMVIQDKARKETLIEHGFRLPSALDNRPLGLEELNKKVNQVIYCSATPNQYEIERALRGLRLSSDECSQGKAGKKSGTSRTPRSRTPKESLCDPTGQASLLRGKKLSARIVSHRDKVPGAGYIIEQLVRPTGLLEPSIEVRPTKNQVKDLIEEIKKRVKKKQRTLALTLTKRLSEDLSDYLIEEGISTQWLHSEVKTLERPQILKGLREGKYDVLVGINLLREGLDLPEVTLVAILDADKEGFLRSKTTLIQTMGRAARHPEGHVILYADKMTLSMQEALREVERRRRIQAKYNKTHKINPSPIIKEIREWPFEKKEIIKSEFRLIRDTKLLEKEMKTAAKHLDFERAAEIRDLIKKNERSK